MKTRSKDEHTAKRIVDAYHTTSPHIAYIVNGLRRIAVDPSDPRARYILQRHGFRYHSDVQTFIYCCLSKLPVDLFLDVGSNFGECAFAAPLFSSTRIVGYEANESLHEYLKKSKDYNDDLRNVEFVHAAVSDRAGDVLTFHIDSAWSGKSSVVEDTSSKQLVKVELPTTSVDHEYERLGQNCKLLLLKVDVEGYEPSVFQGATQTIRAAPNLVCLMEFDSKFLKRGDVNPLEFFARLQQDFFVYELKKDGLREVVKYEDLTRQGHERVRTDLVLVRFSDERLKLLFEQRVASRNQLIECENIGMVGKRVVPNTQQTVDEQPHGRTRPNSQSSQSQREATVRPSTVQRLVRKLNRRLKARYPALYD